MTKNREYANKYWENTKIEMTEKKNLTHGVTNQATNHGAMTQNEDKKKLSAHRKKESDDDDDDDEEEKKRSNITSSIV